MEEASDRGSGGVDIFFACCLWAVGHVYGRQRRREEFKIDVDKFGERLTGGEILFWIIR